MKIYGIEYNEDPYICCGMSLYGTKKEATLFLREDDELVEIEILLNSDEVAEEIRDIVEKTNNPVTDEMFQEIIQAIDKAKVRLIK